MKRPGGHALPAANGKCMTRHMDCRMSDLSRRMDDFMTFQLAGSARALHKPQGDAAKPRKQHDEHHGHSQQGKCRKQK